MFTVLVFCKMCRGRKFSAWQAAAGKISVAFGLLGAEVTVLDLSDVQLDRDRQGAAHHGLGTKTIQGDMRDLSVFPEDSFDIVWQVYSINFVPSVEPVIQEVSRVLKPGGIYFLQFANPFAHSVDEEKWDGQAYPLKDLYLEGEDLSERFPHWDVDQPDGSQVKVPSPHEFRHLLSTMLNTMVANSFILLGLWEWMRKDEHPEPGSWAHFTHVIPPYLSTFWQLEKSPAA